MGLAETHRRLFQRGRSSIILLPPLAVPGADLLRFFAGDFRHLAVNDLGTGKRAASKERREQRCGQFGMGAVVRHP
jgi:hypothetical protein